MVQNGVTMTMPETTTKQDSEPAVDEELLAEAMRGAATSSRNEALNAALRQYVEAKRAQRRQALADVRRMSDEGLFDYDAINEVDE
jgi:Arc/MetJ family transcription regulator